MLNEIKSIIKGEVIDQNLEKYSQDASIFEVKPSLVVQPKDTEDVKNLVKWVSSNKSLNSSLSLTARSGGTDMTGGPLSESIVLDFTIYYNTLLEIRRAPYGTGSGGFAITEPGVYYRDFEKETLKKGLLLPSYPASREICTVGGMVANNSGGEKSLRYGKTEDYVEELNVVLSDGNEYIFKALSLEELEQKKIQNDFEGKIYREMHQLLGANYDLIQKAKPNVSKNSAGYALWNVLTSGSGFDPVRGKTSAESGSSADHTPKAGRTSNGIDLTKLFVGSQGTLGLITKIKFKLVTPSKYSKLLLIFLEDLKPLGDLVNLLSKYNPESIESFDDNTFKIVGKILPKLVSGLGLGVLIRFLPDLWGIILHGVPKMTMIVGFAGNDEEELELLAKNCQKEVSKTFKLRSRIATDEEDANKYWVIRRESFNLLRNKIGKRKTTPFIDDFSIKPEYLPEFLPKLNNILNHYKNYMTYTVAGHPGDGNFHIIPLMDLSDGKTRQLIPEISEKVYNLILEYKGSITAEHNDGLIRTPYVEKMYGTEVYDLFKQVKEIFDPLNIFNPGKKVNGNLNYALEHIKQK